MKPTPPSLLRHLRQAGAFYGPKVTGEFTQSGAAGKSLRIDVESYDYLAKP